MNKKGRIIYYMLFSFIALLLFLPLITFVHEAYGSVRIELDIDGNIYSIPTITKNETVSPVGENITSIVVYRQNSTWLDFDGVDDYLFVEDNSYASVSLWVKDADSNWTHVINISTGLFENNVSVGSLTLNSFKKNATGWYFGINSSGFFNGSIDTIKFYNDTVTQNQVSDIFDDGR